MSYTRARLVADLDLCPCAGGTLDKLLQPAILTLLAKEPLHGYRIAEQVAALPLFHGRKPDVSGVYRFLRAMESRELVTASWDVSAKGPAKRHYRLTAAGRRCLTRWVGTLERYRQAIGSLLTVAKKASATGSRRKKAAAG
jgi:PadR family transcriptional regulator, regulatory protein PadR